MELRNQSAGSRLAHFRQKRGHGQPCADSFAYCLYQVKIESKSKDCVS